MNEDAILNIKQTLEHKKMVGIEMNKVASDLMKRAVEHDFSKFSKLEIEAFTENAKKLKGLTYGSDEYYHQVKMLGPALTHHYAHNRHHPEYFKNGVLDMNLIDLIEMLSDWIAAIKKHEDGNLKESLEHNRVRFKIPDDLYTIMVNTVNYIVVDLGDNK